ncbi:hypothetical protein D3C71_882460 [compost metagenome]
MKSCLTFLSLFSTLLLWSQDVGEKVPSLKNAFNEFHASVNHGIPLSSGMRTFFGAGLGANKVFRAEKTLAFRTGVEFQFFHMLGNSGDPAHYSSVSNVHYSYSDLTIPIVLRINIGMTFIELGGNLGLGVVGQKRYMQHTYSDNQTPVETEKKESSNQGFSAGPVFGIGMLIPMNEKLDLLIRPDVGASVYFREGFANGYVRLCIGIRLK